MSTDTSKTALYSLMKWFFCAASVEFLNCRISTHQPELECVKKGKLNNAEETLSKTSRLKL